MDQSPEISQELAKAAAHQFRYIDFTARQQDSPAQIPDRPQMAARLPAGRTAFCRKTGDTCDRTTI